MPRRCLYHGPRFSRLQGLHRRLTALRTCISCRLPTKRVTRRPGDSFAAPMKYSNIYQIDFVYSAACVTTVSVRRCTFHPAAARLNPTSLAANPAPPRLRNYWYCHVELKPSEWAQHRRKLLPRWPENRRRFVLPSDKEIHKKFRLISDMFFVVHRELWHHLSRYRASGAQLLGIVDHLPRFTGTNLLNSSQVAIKFVRPSFSFLLL